MFLITVPTQHLISGNVALSKLVIRKSTSPSQDWDKCNETHISKYFFLSELSGDEFLYLNFFFANLHDLNHVLNLSELSKMLVMVLSIRKNLLSNLEEFYVTHILMINYVDTYKHSMNSELDHLENLSVLLKIYSFETTNYWILKSSPQSK